MRTASRVALLVALLSLPGLAEDLVVRLENGTNKDLGVAGAEVSLLMPVKDAETGHESRKKVSETVDAGGAARFVVDPAMAGRKINVLVAYKEGFYFFSAGAEIGQAEAGPFAIFESTDDPAAMEIQAHWIQAVPSGNRLLDVTELLVVNNPTEKAYIGQATGGERRATIRLHVPPGAGNLQVEPNGYFLGDLLEPDGEFHDSNVTILPGRHQYVFSYQLAPAGGEFTFAKRFWKEVASLTVLAPAQAGYEMHVGGQTVGVDKDPHTGQEVQFFQTGPVAAGSTIEVHLHATGKPTGGRDAGSGGEEDEGEDEKDGSLWLVLVLGGLLAVGLTIAAIAKPNPGATSEAGERFRDHLIDEIARLDLSKEKGEITADYHGKQREILKKRLLELE